MSSTSCKIVLILSIVSFAPGPGIRGRCKTGRTEAGLLQHHPRRDSGDAGKGDPGDSKPSVGRPGGGADSRLWTGDRNRASGQDLQSFYEILEAEDGEQAIKILNDKTLFVELIICDVRMPKLNGIEAVAYFRREYPKTPVIVLTGYPDVNLGVEFMREGVADYLVKPVEKETLLKAVDKAIGERPRFGDSPGGI